MAAKIACCAVAVVLLAPSATLSADPPAKKPPTRIEGPDKVSEQRVPLKVFVEESLIGQADRDFWLGVWPDLQPDTIWVQVGQVVTTESERVIFVGPRGSKEEKFTIVLFSVPKDRIQKDGPLKVRQLRTMGFKVHARKRVHRLR